MRYPPAAQLPQDRSLAAYGHLARPLAIDSAAESSPRNKGQIDQLDLQLFLRSEVPNDHTIVWFGTRHAPFYQHKTLGREPKIENRRIRQNKHASARHFVYFSLGNSPH